MKTYASLHCHTDHSNASCGFPDSINKVSDSIDLALSLGFSGYAITDHECVSGHVKALNYIKELRNKAEEKVELSNSEEEKEIALKNLEKLNNFKVILGNEAYLSRSDLTKENYQKGERFNHIILLAKDKVGHKQLRKLSSKAWDRAFMRSIMRRYNVLEDFDEIIGEDKGHLIMTTACIGGVLGNYFTNMLREDAVIAANNYIQYMQGVFGYDNFYIELAPGDGDQVEYNKWLYNNFYGKVKFTMATDAHYGSTEDFEIFKTFLNSKDTKDREVEAFYKYARFMTWEEIEELCSYLPQEFLEEMRQNTLDIAASCENYSIDVSPIIPYIPINENETVKSFGDEWKEYPSIWNYLTSDSLADRHLIYKIFKGAQEKQLPLDDEVASRINLELEELWGISEALNQRMSNYLITMTKIIDIIWNEADALVGTSRGSAGCWIVNYLLGITQWNPLRYPLKMEHWRFLHKTRPDLPDIDIDTAGNKRGEVIAAVGEYFKSIGGDLIQVCTYGTEKSKSAIQTVCRGLNIDNETANYISSLIPAERGILLTLDQCYYGDDEHAPIAQFVQAMNDNPKLWDAARKVEGLISSLGVHASGVVLINEDITENNSIMRTTKGVVVTAYDLHESEQLGSVKYDFLSIDALGKIRTCLNYLLRYGYIEWQGNLKSTYTKYLAPENLKYSDELWRNVASNDINSLFQLNTPVGTQALAAINPESLHQVGMINSLMRLMPQNKGDETPIETFRRYKEDIQLWYSEMRNFGLTADEIKIMEDHLLLLCGVADTQESIMMMTMDERISGFNIKEANKLRKGIAKKSKKSQEEAHELFYSKGKELGTSQRLLDYVWKVQVSRQLGYSFSLPHVAGYSMIAMQEANLYTYYPSIYWNTACLSDTVGIDLEEDFADLIEKGYVKLPIHKRKKLEDDYQLFLDLNETDEDLTEEEIEAIKKELYDNLDDEESKTATIKRGKIAAAIGEFQSTFNIEPPLINSSGYGFTPNEKTESITCGLKIVGKIGNNLMKDIINNRPYTSIEDFTSKVKISKDRVVLLIKAGAFRELDSRNRMEVLQDYVRSISDQKKKLTLQNLQMLISYNLIPDDFAQEKKVFNWVKYIRKTKDSTKTNYILDERAYAFYTSILDENKITYNGAQRLVSMSYVDNYYKAQMDKIKKYISANETELLAQLNNLLFLESWNKYKMDDVAHGEMQSMRIYVEPHPLKDIQIENLNISNLNEIIENEQAGTFYIDGKFIPKFKIHHIVGTVINKDKLKNLITVLTPYGPVDVKVWKNTFAYYDKALVEFEGTEKKIIQPSFFANGTFLLLTGMLRGNTFTLKKYKENKIEDVLLKINFDNGISLEKKIGEDE